MLTAMNEQIWHTIIVRAWRDRDGLKIRFMSEDANQSGHSTAVEASIEAAARRFGRWLLSVDAASTHPASPVASGSEEREHIHREDDGATPGKTADA
jgi:site-specific recombinase XerC